MILQSTISKTGIDNRSKNKINLFFMITLYILSAFIINDIEKYSIFISIIYITFLISMGIIILKTMEFNIDNFCIFQGTIFFITGIVECIQLLIIITYDKVHMVTDMRYLLLIIDIVPLFGVYISIKYIHENRNILKDLILFVLFILIMGVFVFNRKEFIYNELLSIFNIEFITNILMFGLGYMTYRGLENSENYLDNQEKIFLKRMIIIISLSRTPYLYHKIINSMYLEYIISNFIKSISIIYLYRYITYSIFYKPYIKLDEANLKLIDKNNYFKEQNIKLIEETKKIIHLKDIFENKENKLKLTLDTSTNCIIVFNDKKEMTYANKKFKEIFKCNKDDKIYNYNEYLKNEIINYTVFISCIDNIINGKSIVTKVIELNNNRIYKATFSPLIIKGKIQGVLCILIDNTSKAISENKIIELNSKYIRFLESIGDGIIVLQNNKKTYVNKACRNMLKDKLYDIDFNLYDKKSKVEDLYEVD